MSDEKSSKSTEKAMRGSGENDAIGAGPEKFPRTDDPKNEGSPGNYFGDKKPRTPDSEGQSLGMGLSCRIPFHDETVESLGEGRDESTGKPDGPEEGSVDNGGASAKLEWD